MDYQTYDVIIVGAGPAGLFAADTLSSAGLKVAIIDKGRDADKRICPAEKNGKTCFNCRPCNIYAGFGGAGGKSDGKLNFHPRIGGDLYEFTAHPEKYIQIVNEVFTELSGVMEYSLQPDKVHDLVYKALQNGLEFVIIKQKHIGSDKLVEVLQKFKQRLLDKRVDIFLMTHVKDIIVENGKAAGVIVTNGSEEKLFAKTILLCPGREGSSWFGEMCDKYNIEKVHLPIDIGVRIETNNMITKPITDIQYCPKIKLKYHDDEIRNFCTNPEGFVVTENYGEYCLVNGHAKKGEKSENCNFAVLYRVYLTKPETDTTAYGMNIARTFNNLGKQKPIVQRLEDFRRGRRSTEARIAQSNIVPTLKDAVPGDISLAMPAKILRGIWEYLERLETLMPGLCRGNNTLIYAPEIKFKAMKGRVDANLESTLPGLFLAGDGCGLSGGIVQAAVTGILAAEGIIRKI